MRKRSTKLFPVSETILPKADKRKMLEFYIQFHSLTGSNSQLQKQDSQEGSNKTEPEAKQMNKFGSLLSLKPKNSLI